MTSKQRIARWMWTACGWGILIVILPVFMIEDIFRDPLTGDRYWSVRLATQFEFVTLEVEKQWKEPT